MAYTPGVARVCSAIADQPELASEYTWTGNTVAVVSDGTAVLGLGDIGPAAAMPVMEGKALLFKRFAGINAVPVCIACTDVDEVVRTVAALAPSFGGINLEDISAPRCFEIEDRLRAMLDIPVFHDDQHGTAIVTLAALRGAARVVGKGLGDLRVVVCGAGASGIAVSKILLSAGVGDIAVADSKGLIYDGRDGLNPVKAALAKVTNAAGLAGSPEAALRGADVFIGLSGSTLAEEAIARMAPGAIAFLLSNPDPEIHPDVARRHVAVVATGRSDFPNQINNSLAFPGVFRAALDVRASTVTERMKLAAADAIAALVGGDAAPDYVIPSQFDERVAPAVAAAVAAAARADGVARR
jgi:malate dehydrogenase (oxaloacetate-decarboxylating)